MCVNQPTKTRSLILPKQRELNSTQLRLKWAKEARENLDAVSTYGKNRELINSPWINEIGSFHNQNADVTGFSRPQLGIQGNKVDTTTSPNWIKATKPVRYLFKQERNFIKKHNMTPAKSVYTCGHAIGKDVFMMKNLEHKSYSFLSVESCNNVWACPVCRSKVIKKRGESIKRANVDMPDMHTYHLVLTVPHNFKDKLKDLIGTNKDKTGIVTALKGLRQSRAWRNMKDNYWYEGDVKAIEVTKGENGWHPHYHVVMYLWEELDDEAIADIKDSLTLEWRNQVKKYFGRRVSDDGVYFDRISKDNVDYITKWGGGEEVTAFEAKKGKTEDSFSIAEMERNMLEENDQQYKFKRDLTEYYHTMHGHRMMAVSGTKQFRELFSDIISDEKMAEESAADNIEMSEIRYAVPRKTYMKFEYDNNLATMLQDLSESCEDRQTDFIKEFKQYFPHEEPPRLVTEDEVRSFQKLRYDLGKRRKNRLQVAAFMRKSKVQAK